MAYFFVFLLLLSIFVLVFTYAHNIYKTQLKCLLFVVVLALIGIGVCIEVPADWDIDRHYDVINGIRMSTDSLSTFLQYSYLTTGYNYMFTYVYNIMIYYIARFFPNQALPFIAISVVYSIFMYIFYNEFYERGHNVRSRCIVLSFAICIVLMPYIYVYSNIRNPLAVSLVALGIYKYYKQNSLIVFMLLTVCATLIHPVAIAIIPFVFLSHIKPGMKSTFVALVLPSILFPVLEFFSLWLNSAFLAGIAYKYYSYTMLRTDYQGKIFLYSTILLLLVIFIVYMLLQRNVEKVVDVQTYRLLNLFIWYSMFALGFWQNYSLITRLPYSIACLSPIIVKTLFNRRMLTTPVLKVVSLCSEWAILALGLLGVYNNIIWLL